MRRHYFKMASGYWESVDSDSRFQLVSDPPYHRCGQRLRTRRRGTRTYFPRHSKNVVPRSAADHRCNSDEIHAVESISSRNEERTGRPRDRFNKFGEKYRCDQHTFSTGNSEDFFRSERHSDSVKQIQIERDKEERTQDRLFDVISYNNGGRQRASDRANNSSFWEEEPLNWRDKSEITHNFYSCRGRGGRARGRRIFDSHSTTEENPFQLDWRKELTDISKAVRCFVWQLYISVVL